MRCSQLALAIFVAAAVIQGAALPTAVADDWRTYRNERYGTTIDYPDIFKAEPPPANNDGLAFKSDDGAAFSVFASFNALDFDLAGFKDFTMKNLEAGEVITYQAQGKDWFVISEPKAPTAYSTNDIFCRMANSSRGLCDVLSGTPKQKYDPICSRGCRSRFGPVPVSRRSKF